MTPDTTLLTFVEKKHEYAEVYSYTFKPSQPVPFAAGSYAHLRITSLPETARRVREISFASSPDDALIQFGIDGRSGSDYQKAFQALMPGDTIEMFKIKSHMTWPSESSEIVMIAGGIGVTPFRSMLRNKAKTQLPVTSTLLHVSGESFLYDDELRMLATEYRQTAREGLFQALTEITEAHSAAHYYIAGSPSFVDSVSKTLSERGIARIESDPFKGLGDESE